MITIKEAEEILKKEYHIDNFGYLVGELLLPDYSEDKHDVNFDNSLFSSVMMLGESKQCEVTVFEVIVNEGCQNRRVGITQEMFRILRGLHINNALVAFVNADKNNYRISLLTSKYEFDGDKIVRVLSNPRRYSYSLGFGTKTKTAYKFLIEKGKVSTLDELIGRFSIEVVNKQFYSEIATAFTELVGGERNGKKYEKLLDIYSIVDHNKYAEFGVRLIGRIMFCWFLREKRSENGIPLVPDDMLSLKTVTDSNNYYHQILEPLFFELLNTNQNRRKPEFQTDYYSKVPYLNGGLFSPQTDDHYKYDTLSHCGAYGVVSIPNEWFNRLFAVLNEYNFTVDENTAYDIELSIDPEMLGRIFENLLAEINPETGENAKKSTGSFYTPRDKLILFMMNFIEQYKTTGYDEAGFEILRKKTDNPRTLLFLDIAEEVYHHYQNVLKQSNQIDFADMINDAHFYLQEIERQHIEMPYKYIIIDEFQDIARQRFNLTKRLSEITKAKVVAVGDDWQSIYAFSGSDITLFTRFLELMGAGTELKITHTYRNSQELIDIAGGFVQKNSAQIRKQLISPKHLENPVVIEAFDDSVKPMKALSEKVEEIIGKIIAEYGEKSSILLIGRYNYDMYKLYKAGAFTELPNNRVKSEKYPNADITFMTAHSSKGLGYDNVILVNMFEGKFGFPCQIEDDPIMKLVMHEDRSMPFAEERRLFYVAMTRTKNRVYIATPTIMHQ